MNVDMVGIPNPDKIPISKLKQPPLCVGCDEGKWDGVAQFCRKPIGCVKSNGGDKK